MSDKTTDASIPTNPIEREIVSVASSEVEVFAVELEFTVLHRDEPGVLSSLHSSAWSGCGRRGQETGNDKLRGREQHSDYSVNSRHGFTEKRRRASAVHTTGRKVFIVREDTAALPDLQRSSSSRPPRRRGSAESWQGRATRRFPQLLRLADCLELALWSMFYRGNTVLCPRPRIGTTRAPFLDRSSPQLRESGNHEFWPRKSWGGLWGPLLGWLDAPAAQRTPHLNEACEHRTNRQSV